MLKKVRKINIKKNNFYYKFLKNILVALISIVLYYLIFSPFWDNPIEYELKRTNTQLKTELERIKENVNLIDSTYKSLDRRDSNLHYNLFNVMPKEPIKNQIQAKRNTAKYYENAEISTLIEILDQKTKYFSQEVSKGTELIVNLEREMCEAENKFARYPSIQPIDNPQFTKSIVGAGMKMNPFHKGYELHEGFDYAIDENTRIFATADGVVSRVGSLSDRDGLSVEIDHQNGYKTRYSNINKATVRRNETVAKGDIVAYSGNSGYSFLPHLHYEVIYKGKKVNPENFFFAEFSIYDFYYLQYITKQTIQSFD